MRLRGWTIGDPVQYKDLRLGMYVSTGNRGSVVYSVSYLAPDTVGLTLLPTRGIVSFKRSTFDTGWYEVLKEEDDA